MPITSAEFQQTRVTVIKSYGNKVDLSRTNAHRHTNIFIEESKPFYPQETLPIYRGAPLWLAAVFFLCSVGGAANLTAAIVGLLSDLPLIVLYCQNEVVNRISLPIVKKQETCDDLPTLNALLEISVTELEKIGISTDNVEIGLLKMEQTDKFKLQVFHPEAFKIMDKAKTTSRFLLGVFLVAALYNIICIIVHSLI